MPQPAPIETSIPHPCGTQAHTRTFVNSSNRSSTVFWEAAPLPFIDVRGVEILGNALLPAAEPATPPPTPPLASSAAAASVEFFENAWRKGGGGGGRGERKVREKG